MEDSEKDSGEEDFEKKLLFWKRFKKATAFWTFK